MIENISRWNFRVFFIDINRARFVFLKNESRSWFVDWFVNKIRLKKVIKNFEAIIAHLKFIKSNNFSDSHFINKTSFKNSFTTSVSNTFITSISKNYTNINLTLFIFDIIENISRDDITSKFSNFDFNDV